MADDAAAAAADARQQARLQRRQQIVNQGYNSQGSPPSALQQQGATDASPRVLPSTRSSVATEASLNAYATRPLTNNVALSGPSIDPQTSPKTIRTRRRLQQGQLSTDGSVVAASQESMAPLRSSQEPSRAGSQDRDINSRISRITAKALMRASSRDSGSERDSKAPPRDVFRDDRGRRVTRPQVVRSDIHMIGEIVGATGFKPSQPALFCRYRLMYDGVKSWAVARGMEYGTTHVANAGPGSDDGLVVWEHPLDLHLTTQKLEAWPRLLLMVYARDDTAGKDVFVAYGMCPLPSMPGIHHLSCRTWFPVETDQGHSRNFFSAFLDIAPRLEDDLSDTSFLTDLRVREEAGPYITSQGAGVVHLRLQVLCRHLDVLTQQLADSLYKSLENFQASVEASRKKELMRSAAMQEYQEGLQRSSASGEESAGLRQVREGRQARFDTARQALEARRSGQNSPASSTGGGGVQSRSQSVDAAVRRPTRANEPRNAQSAPRDSRSGAPEPRSPTSPEKAGE